MFTHNFYFAFIIILCFNNYFTYTKCSLLSRVKNPVEHLSETTLSYILPNNVFRYEPYRGGPRTLWIPTKKKKVKTNKGKSLAARHRPTVNNKIYRYHHRQITPVTTTLKYWHHFYEDEEAWPKVVLILSSTERTTTAKLQTKTFANYFPSLYKPVPEAHTEAEDRNNSNDNTQEEREESDETEQADQEVTPYTTAESSGDANEDDDKEEDDADENNEEFRVKEDLATMGNEETTTTSETSDTISTVNESTEKQQSTDETSTLDSQLQVTETSIPYNQDLTTTTTKTEMTTKATRIVSRDETTLAPTTTTVSTTTKPVDARCFQCGLNTSEIPYAPTCHHVFDAPDRTLYALRRFYKVICKNEAARANHPVGYLNDYIVSPPDKTFRGGCFKRFLDLGEVYNERGCRTMLPQRGNSLASVRLMRLERSMSAVDEGCVSSPHATLTPFSKAVSLYSRYHVCVCVGAFCNHATTLKLNPLYVLFLNIFKRI